MKNQFRVKYKAADGYVGKDRPLFFNVDSQDVEDCMDDEEVTDLYLDMIQDDFEKKVFAEGENIDEFLVWARHVRRSR